MSDRADFGEPWRDANRSLLGDWDRPYGEMICDRDGDDVLGVPHAGMGKESYHLKADELVRRIIALINLTAGIPTESLLNPDCQLHVTYKLGGKTPGSDDA